MQPALAPDVSAYNDADLLDFIALSDEDRDLARAAFEALYHAQAPRLHRVLQSVVAGVDGPTVDDLVHDVFEIVLAQAHTFQAKTAYDTTEDAHRHVAGWLGRIAKRHWRRSVKGQPLGSGIDPDTLPSFDAEPSLPAPRHVDMLKRLRDCLSALPPTRRLAVLAVYGSLSYGSSRLPDGAPARIAAELSTTPAGLRQARSRGERDLADCLGVSTAASH